MPAVTQTPHQCLVLLPGSLFAIHGHAQKNARANLQRCCPYDMIMARTMMLTHSSRIISMTYFLWRETGASVLSSEKRFQLKQIAITLQLEGQQVVGMTLGAVSQTHT